MVRLPVKVALLFAAVLLIATLCQAQWVEIYSSVPPGWHNNGWNILFYGPDTDLFYLYASNYGGITPESNSLWSYAIQPGPTKSNPWVKVSTCGDEITPANTQTN